MPKITQTCKKLNHLNTSLWIFYESFENLWNSKDFCKKKVSEHILLCKKLPIREKIKYFQPYQFFSPIVLSLLGWRLTYPIFWIPTSLYFPFWKKNLLRNFSRIFSKVFFWIRICQNSAFRWIDAFCQFAARFVRFSAQTIKTKCERLGQSHPPLFDLEK